MFQPFSPFLSSLCNPANQWRGTSDRFPAISSADLEGMNMSYPCHIHVISMSYRVLLGRLCHVMPCNFTFGRIAVHAVHAVWNQAEIGPSHAVATSRKNQGGCGGENLQAASTTDGSDHRYLGQVSWSFMIFFPLVFSQGNKKHIVAFKTYPHQNCFFWPTKYLVDICWIPNLSYLVYNSYAHSILYDSI